MQDALSANQTTETNMSPHAVNDLATSFVQMAKAFEELPQVQHQLEETQKALDDERKTVQDRELSIMKLKQETEELQAKLRKTEADRDDAEFRFLLADERTTKALEFIKTSFGSAGTLIQSLEADKAKDVKSQGQSETTPTQTTSSVSSHSEPSSAHDFALPHATLEMGQSELPSTPTQPEQHGSESAVPLAHPTTVPTPNSTNTATDASSASSVEHGSIEAGQSATHPTVAEESKETGQSASTLGVTNTENVSQSSTTDTSQKPDDKPYFGKLYVNFPHYLSLAEWLAGGGTEDNYYYRNDRKSWAG